MLDPNIEPRLKEAFELIQDIIENPEVREKTNKTHILSAEFHFRCLKEDVGKLLRGSRGTVESNIKNYKGFAGRDIEIVKERPIANNDDIIRDIIARGGKI